MKTVLQRVSEASVKVDGEIIGSIKHGLVGKFGADMKVSLINDGPVTIIMESLKQAQVQALFLC